MSYQQLEVWQKGCDLAVAVYQATGQGPLARDYGLKDQMQRAAVSIPSNIAEGESRESPKETIRYLFIARGSLAELDTQTRVAERIGLLPAESSGVLRERMEEIGKMLRGLIRAKETQIRS